MDGLENTDSELSEITRNFKGMAGPGCKTAMGVLLVRLAESMKPEGERICCDPYAVHFVSQEMMDWMARHPEEARAMREKREHLLPGMDDSIRARVRYFDDFLKRSMDEGLEQLVILGAGYDTRDCRVEGMEMIKVFEVDHPATQAIKTEKIKKILGSLPEHIAYVPVDLAGDDLGQRLMEKGYDMSRKTLFIMEGLLYYLSPEVVDEILSFIAKNSGHGSRILFDYYPQSVVDGSCEIEIGRTLCRHLAQLGETLLFGIEEGNLEAFLEDRGFSHIHKVTSQDYKKAYFCGSNEGRKVCPLMYFAHAEVK